MRSDAVKLNVGCGKRHLPGYIGVDISPNSAASIVAAAHAIPLDCASVDEILAVHVVEHVYEWDVPALLREWARLLKPGGLLVIEMPDLRKACRNLLEDRRIGSHPDQAHLWAIYGDATLRDPLMMHKSGWWFERLAPLVKAAGFEALVEKDTQFHAKGRGVRDFRLEARRSA